MELTLKERRKLTRVTAGKYRKVGKREKTAILDTFVEQTGYGRKYAIHLLANEGKCRAIGGTKLKAAHAGGRRRVYERIYDDEVLDTLVPIWEAFSRQCGKLLAPFIRANIDAIAGKPRFAVSNGVREKLGRISAATIDRLLRKEKARARVKGTCGTKPAKSHIKALIPVMSHFECAKQGAGLWQIDLVQHDGGNPSGEFCFTLTVTEVAHCWTVHYPLRNKAFRWVYEALNRARAALPVPVRILHADNGGEFINHALKLWCDSKGMAVPTGKTTTASWSRRTSPRSGKSSATPASRTTGGLPRWARCTRIMTIFLTISIPARRCWKRSGSAPGSGRFMTNRGPRLTGLSRTARYPGSCGTNLSRKRPP